MYKQWHSTHTNTISRRIQELKEQYESKIVKHETYRIPLLPVNDDKNSSQRRVKQITQMFNNSKEIIKRDNGDFKYKRLDNTCSLQSSSSSPIVPKLRNKFLSSNSEKALKPETTSGSATSKSFCLVTESAFNKLSVKDRVKLYTKFIEDLSNGRTTFSTKNCNTNNNDNNNSNNDNHLRSNERETSVQFILQKFENLMNSKDVQYCENEDIIKEDLEQMEKSFECNISIKDEISPLKELFYKWLSDHDSSSNNISDDGSNEQGSTPSYSDSEFIESPTTSDTDGVHEIISLESNDQNHKQCDNNNEMFIESHYVNVTKIFKDSGSDESLSKPSTNYEETATLLIDNTCNELVDNFCNTSDDDVPNSNDTPNSKNIQCSKCVTIGAPTEMENSTNDQDAYTTMPKESRQHFIRQAVKEFIMEESAIMSLSENSDEDISPVKPIKNYTESESGLSSLPKMSSDDSPDEKKWKFGKKLKQRFSLPLSNRASKEKTLSPNLNNTHDWMKTKNSLHRKSSYIRKLFGTKRKSTVDDTTFTKRHENSIEEVKCSEKVATKKKKSLRRKSSTYIKTLFGSKKVSADDQTDDSTFMKRHEDLMRAVNSPRKIDAAYTLTCLTPSPPTTKDKVDNVNSKSKCQSQSASDSAIKNEDTYPKESEKPQPVCKHKLNFSSTPIKGHESSPMRTPKHSLLPFEGNLGISPIVRRVKTWPRSYREISSTCRRNSLPMPVIRENEPANFNGTISPPSLLKRCSLYSTDSTASYASPYKFSKKSQIRRDNEKVSEFWIKCGDFTFVFDIDYEAPEKLRWKYEMFSKVSMETRQTNFGIDNYMFTWNQPLDNNNSCTSARQSSALHCRNGSHYWIITGNLAIPFNGLHLNSQKIKSYFHFIASAVQETKTLRFGVDNVEFSKIPEYIYNTPKLSLDSNFSQLIGLQATPMKNLSDFRTNQWPRYHSKFMEATSEEDGESYARSSIATTTTGKMNPFQSISNTFDLPSLDGGVSCGGSKWFSSLKNEYESASIEDLFQQKNFKQKPLDKFLLMANIQHTKRNLLKLQNRLNQYQKPENLSSTIIDDLKGSPEYLIKLKTLTNNIKKLCDNNVLQNCTKQELENYMYILTRYTDICLSDCIFNIDKVFDALEDKSDIYPPENELQKSHDQNPAALSEHQLRIQASLQRLNIPDWFRQYNQTQANATDGGGGIGAGAYRPGNFTRKRTQDSGRWAGLNSKTTSLSSLGSQRSDRSPLLLSPSAHSHHGGQSVSHQHHYHPHHSHHVGSMLSASIIGSAGEAETGRGSGGASAGTGSCAFSRWSTSHLNSSQISPCVSQRSSFSRGGPINSSFISIASGHNTSAIRNSMRQPYLGWRSQEKLSQRTAHERLASSLLLQQQQNQQQQQRTSPSARQTLPCITNQDEIVAQNKLPPPITPEIQSSIKEVTSAIVHYVNDQTNQQRSRSTSPNSRKCWLESSFVGTRPLDSPQTPIIESTSTAIGIEDAAIASATATGTATLFLHNYNQYGIHINNIGNIDNRIVTAATRTTRAPSLYGNNSTIDEAFKQQRMNNSCAYNSSATTVAARNLGSIGIGIGGGSGGTDTDAGASERSLSNASLEDVLTSLLGLSTTLHTTTPTATVTTKSTINRDDINNGGRFLANTNQIQVDVFNRSSTANESLRTDNKFKHMSQQEQQYQQQKHFTTERVSKQTKEAQGEDEKRSQFLLILSKEEQQSLRRRSEGDAPTQKAKEQHQEYQKKLPQSAANGSNSAKATYASDTLATRNGQYQGQSWSPTNEIGFMSPRRISLGDSTESNNKTFSASNEQLQVKCRNTKCDHTTTPADAKKYYKSCHNCTNLYCSRECRRAHWEKHRKACLHSRASNLCRQVLATCKDDIDSQRHLSFLARQGFLSQGRGVVRILFRSAEAAEGFIKHGFQCMGEASYVRWPDLMPAEMGLELYSELLRFSTEYKPESKMLVYVAICVVSETPGMGQTPVRWERQLVSRCAKLKLCKPILIELEQQHQQPSSLPAQGTPIISSSAPTSDEQTTEVLILTFNPQLRSSIAQRELIFTNIIHSLSRRGVVLRRHYPEIFQRLLTFAEGQTDKFNPVTLHPRNSQTGQNFVCIIMPVHSDSEIVKLPSATDGGNRVTTIDVGSPAAKDQLNDDELLTRPTTS